MKTLAQEILEENERLRCRFIHHTRRHQNLTMDEAMKLQQALIDSSEFVENIKSET